MFKILLYASFAVAMFFIVNSAFRRRLIWSLKVTLGFYAVMTALRFVVVGIYKIFQPGHDESGLFIAIAAIGLASAAVWVASRYLTERHLRSTRRQAAGSGRRRRR